MSLTPEQRSERRLRASALPRPLLELFRTAADRTHTLVGAVGVFLIAGFVVAVTGTVLFAELAEHVRAGGTTAFDDAVLTWLGTQHTPLLDTIMLEFTAIGTGSVVLMIAGISGMFLYLTRHKYSALLLLVSTAGGIALNAVLKLGFHRPRPHIIEWGTQAVSSSFPSGHAMNAAIVYGTVAYLAARLQKRLRWKIATLVTALILIAGTCLSRVYLGVHYPTDVAAGVVIGLAWAGLCMAALESLQILAMRRAPEILESEEPPPDASD